LMKYKISFYTYIKNMKYLWHKEVEYRYINGYKISKYNYNLIFFIFLLLDKEFVSKEFHILLHDILTANYKNIKYDLTVVLILDYFHSIKTINYFESIGFFYLLELIHPNELSSYHYKYNLLREKAVYIYNKKIESPLSLKWTWLGVGYKAHICFALTILIDFFYR